MWNTRYSNRIVNFHNKIREQRLHLERLVTIKPMVDIKEPYQPAFLKKNLKKKEMEEEKQATIDYQNRIYTRKIIEAAIKPGYYNSEILSPKKYPAFEKEKHFYSKAKEQYDINKSNQKMYMKIITLKGNYDTKNLLKRSKQDEYYKDNISKFKTIQEPSLYFETPDEFKRKLEIKLANELLMEQFRPQSTKCSTTDRKKKANTTSSGNNVQTKGTGTLSTNPPVTSI